MAVKKSAYLILLIVFCSKVESASILERSYEYFMNLGKSWAPSFMSFVDCISEDEPLSCAKEKAGKLLDSWDEEVNKQRSSWQDEADGEIRASGRSMDQMPSKIGQQLEDSLNSLGEIVYHGMARALSKKHDSGGIDTITISTGGEKKKMKKKKPKPPKIHLVHPMVVAPMQKDEKEQRGKKKKKKKAILKLLILGAVLKAKIGTLLQILSFKLQVKFFLIALIGLGINLARLWIDIKNKHSHQPQKVIYYEHAQHQHHYDHEEDSHGWGPWSRSIDPEETSELDLDPLPQSPYHGQERQDVQYRPLLTKD